jgi:tRNA modification GTPase
MFHTDDTIVAIATPLGRSGVGIVRVSGPDAQRIACALLGRTKPLRPRYATFARLTASLSARVPDAAEPTVPAARGAVADQVIATSFPAPHSYTGDDIVEISAHGSPIVLEGVLAAAIEHGARLAEPGEFTLRAFLNGKLDLVQAEAVADLIDAVTPLQARAAFDQLDGTLTEAIGAIERPLFDLRARLEASLDFPDEGYHFVDRAEVGAEIAALIARIEQLLARAAQGRLIREGAQIAIVGTPNVGKSSLFNALANANRAIVTDVPGTTRDLLTERVDVRGLSVGLVDTAGIRASGDEVEQEGIQRARTAARMADLVLVVIDRSRPLSDGDRALLDDTASRTRVVILNKADLKARVDASDVAALEPVTISVTSGEGLDTLLDRVARELGRAGEARDAPLVSNVRHITLLEHARTALSRARQTIASDEAVSEEFLLADLQEVDAALQEVTGRRTTDDLLRHIFERFCIGK